MPAGLADAVNAALSRLRAVPAEEAAAIATLAAPDDAVAELQLDAARDTVSPVIGFAASGTRTVLAAATPASPARERWLADVAPLASHWGAKLGPARQLYARGRFAAPAIAAPLLAAAGAHQLAMLGLDLDGADHGRAIGYLAVIGAAPAIAFAHARGVPGAAAAIASLAPHHDWLHLSWDLATATGGFKVDAGPHTAEQLAALALAVDTRGLGAPSHVGLRIAGSGAISATLYVRITAS